MTITLEEIKADKDRLVEKIAAFERAQPRTINLQHIAIVLADGETYAGLILNDDGTPSHHLVLLPGETEATWADAKAWAAKAGGELPTRPVAALLYANAKDQFESTWHWTSETLDADTGDKDDASYAWHCGFYGGTQLFDTVSSAGAARAVRLIHLEG